MDLENESIEQESIKQQARAWEAVWRALRHTAEAIMYSFPDMSMPGQDRAVSTIHFLAQRARFQARVQPWMLECFGGLVAGDQQERNYRFLEEALELVQACGGSREDAHLLVDYVFDRPIGEAHQEVGGVMVTLAALCLAHDLDMHDCGETELERISQPDVIDKIRFKHAAKPLSNSPLPGQPAED